MTVRHWMKRSISLLLALAVLLGFLPGRAEATQAGEPLRNEESAVTAEEIRQAVEGLREPTGALKYGNERADLTGYRTFEEQGTGGEKIHTALDCLKGRYYLTAEVDGSYYLFNGAQIPTNGRANAYGKRLQGNSLDGVAKHQTMLFIYKSTNANLDCSYVLRFAEGDYLLRVQNAEALLANSESQPSHTAWVWSSDEEKIVINDYYNEGKQRYCIALAQDKKSFGWEKTDHYGAHGLGTDYTRLVLFRYCYTLTDLYNAIGTMKSYLTRPEGASDEMYRSFLDSYATAVALYTQYNVTLTEELFLKSEYIQTQIDAIRNEILSYQKLMDPSLAYLDIPIKVLDFRADGYLFENPATFVAPYNLSQNSPPVVLPDGSSIERPGRLGWGENHTTETDLAFFVEGLTEPELVNGSIVYTPEVISYIANALIYYKNYEPNPAHYQKNWNRVFYDKKNSADFTLGSWDQTLGKINYTNGNPLRWEQVETAFDLAYYMLLYVWRPTEEGDVIQKAATVNSGTADLAYNMAVPELEYLRLYYDTTTGRYKFASGQSYSRSGGYIFNDGQSKISGSPGFNVVHDLGFESPELFPPKTTGSGSDNNNTVYKQDSNFFYSLHAESKFVYYKEKNYFFDFTGDDDVYFFINDVLICDIGGIHGSPRRSVGLEDKMPESEETYAEYLGLKDGDICSFDMFFADRHLTGINLTFETNIQLLNEDVVTEKHQYLVQYEGQNMVDSITGMGEYLQDNSIVNIGDTVAYSYDLLNRGQVPVNRVSFLNEDLGTELSDSVMVLSDPKKTNGVVTDYSDLILFYGPYGIDVGADFGRQAEKLDFAAMKTLLEQMNEATLIDGDLSYPVFPQRLYCFTPTETLTLKEEATGEERSYTQEEQLRCLLDLGVPAQGHLKLYGIGRKTTSEDMPFRNVLRSVCYDKVNGNQKIEGLARRSVRVPDLSNYLRPDAVPAETVIDYGKPVELPYSDLRGHFFPAPSQKIEQFIGLTPSGANGELLTNLPAELYCSAVGQTMTRNNGIFTRGENGIIFALSRMLSEVERVFGVFAISGCYGPGTNGTSVAYKYIQLEISLIPATVMYYETDFADGVFSTEQKGSPNGPWTTTPEGAESDGEYQDYDPAGDNIYDLTIDRERIPANAFFVDFDGTGNAKRYSVNPIYKGLNFDTVGAWASSTNASGVENADNQPNSNFGIDTTEGTIRVTVGDTSYTNTDNGVNYGYGPHVFTYRTSAGDYYPISMAPVKDSYVQIRFRLENCQVVEGEAFQTILVYRHMNMDRTGKTYSTEAARQTVENYDTELGEYITLKMPIAADALWNTADRIAAIGFRFKGIKNKPGMAAAVVIDYIYIGPEVGMTSNLQTDNCLYFGFENTTADTNRYKRAEYGTSYSFDRSSNPHWGMAYGSNPTGFTVTNGVLTMEVEGNTDSSREIRVGTSNTYGKYPFHNSKYHPLSFSSDYAQALELRLKISGCKNVSSNPYIRVIFYYMDTSVEAPYFFSNGSGERAMYVTGEMEDYQTLTLDISKIFTKKVMISAIGIAFYGLESKSTTNLGTIAIDYLYVGPKMACGAPSRSLYFGFGNTSEDQERYDAYTYGKLNYDTYRDTNFDGTEYYWATAYGTGQWEADGANHGRAFRINNADGTMTAYFGNKVNAGVDACYRLDMMPAKSPGRYVYTYAEDAEQYLPLYYRPNVGDCIQVRLKFDNCADGSAEDGRVDSWPDEIENRWDLPSMDVRMDYWDSSGVLHYATQRTMSIEVDLDREGYQILTIPITHEVAQAACLRGLDLRFWHIKPATGEVASVTVDYIYLGPGNGAPETVYGFDTSYRNDPQLSDGTSLYVLGNGVETDGNGTKASFDFRGTGFDIISRTGKDQATIRVEVKNKTSGAIEKYMTVNNKGELELYQIPVVSVQGLAYGDYTVTLWVHKAVTNSLIETLNRGAQFYFDGVRIYDPMGKHGGVDSEVLHAYRKDKEAYSHVKEIRNILLSATEYESIPDAGSGAIFVDMKEIPTEYIPTTDSDGKPTQGTTVMRPNGIQLTGQHYAEVETYNKIGPKNEVYLAPGQALAFKLQISTTYLPTSVDVGVKTIRVNEPACLVAAVVKDYTTGQEAMEIDSRREITLNSATAQYYALKVEGDVFAEADGKRYCYIVLYNKGQSGTTTNVLSVTDLKLAYDSMPEVGLPQDGIGDRESPNLPKRNGETAYFDFMVDGHTLKAAALVMGSGWQTPVLKEGSKIMHSLDLASDISVNYVIAAEELADYDSFYLECRVAGNRPVRLEGRKQADYFYFTLEGLTAVQMTDVIEATLHMEKDGCHYYTATDSYSIAQYAYAQLGKANAGQKLKKLCAELLRYGTMAQRYKDYRTQSLADQNMTEKQRACLTELGAVNFGNTDRQLAQLSKPTAQWVGKALILDSKVTLRYVVDLPQGVGESISLHVLYTDSRGREQTVILTEAKPYGNREGRYSFDLDCLLASELRTVLRATVYAGQEQISNTLEYSIDTYGNNKTGALADLCAALVAYSDSAKAYFIH